jgi:transposase InsO family protein
MWSRSMDWASRAVLSWRLSNTMDGSFAVAALEEALARFGRPELFNTDQGSQFTSAGFTGKLMAARVRISMDGRGRWIKGLGARERIEICAEVSVVDSGRQFPAPLPGQRLRH